MDSFAWLTPCTDALKEAGTACVETWQVAYLGCCWSLVVVLFIAARRSRDMSTAVLALMPVAIALNIVVGSMISLLKLPIYLDSIGTVLVGALAGPWAGALTGLLANLIWALLPVPGGAGPVIAFFAPGGPRDRPDGRLLGRSRRLPDARRRSASRFVPGAVRGHRRRRTGLLRRPADDRHAQPEPARGRSAGSRLLSSNC